MHLVRGERGERVPSDPGSEGHHEHDVAASKASWREVLGRALPSSDALWSDEANPQLVAESPGCAGAALDVGCGEGADAIWWPAGMAGHRHRHLRWRSSGPLRRATPVPRSPIASPGSVDLGERTPGVRSISSPPSHAPPRTRARPAPHALAAAVAPAGHC